jgi:hypothetical protein
VIAARPEETAFLPPEPQAGDTIVGLDDEHAGLTLNDVSHAPPDQIKYMALDRSFRPVKLAWHRDAPSA